MHPDVQKLIDLSDSVALEVHMEELAFLAEQLAQASTALREATEQLLKDLKND